MQRHSIEPAPAKPVYYVSTRPEAYEYWGEVGADDARRLGEIIAAQAARHFPAIEFRADDAWHVQPEGTEAVSAYIERHWQAWVAATAGHGAPAH